MQKANGKNSMVPIYDELYDKRIHGEGYRLMMLQAWEDAKPKIDMLDNLNKKEFGLSKAEVRSRVNKILKTYNGNYPENILEIIKEAIKNEKTQS